MYIINGNHCYVNLGHQKLSDACKAHALESRSLVLMPNAMEMIRYIQDTCNGKKIPGRLL